MNNFHIKKGLTLPLEGTPSSIIENAPTSRTVALVCSDYMGMKPSVLVGVGDRVSLGQALFTCKKNPGVTYNAPAGGKIVAIHRGERRALQSLEIAVEHDASAVSFASYRGHVSNRKQIVDLLVESGQWVAFRTRPFSQAPAIDSTPKAIFVNAMDTNPLAAEPQIVLREYQEHFFSGLKILTHLTEGKVYLCCHKNHSFSEQLPEKVVCARFWGKHPAGNSGTHIHYLEPVSSKKTVWTIGYQDVIAIGKLFSSGKLWTQRVISVAGQGVKNPRLLRTCLGANIYDILADDLLDSSFRIISGSPFHGRRVEGVFSYLGRFHQQVCVIAEPGEREFLGWQSPGLNKFSVKPIFLSKLFPKRMLSLNSDLHGSYRAMIPIGMFEKVMPGDFLPTQLLRALITSDLEKAEALGCLELDEEDLALCTFVSPGKYDFGPQLRKVLTTIQKEG